MYKFVKIVSKYGGEKNKGGFWYFVPNSVEQVIEHFNKIFGQEIKAGIKDKVGSIEFNKHPETAWRHAVDVANMFSGNSWLMDAVNLENQVLHNRINDFLNFGKIYLADGVQQLGFSDSVHEIVEEVECEELVYPREAQFHLEEVRYMQWDVPGYPKGEHWYAKIGNMDVRDKQGNMKWNTKEEAEAAAAWFCQKLNWKNYYGSRLNQE